MRMAIGDATSTMTADAASTQATSLHTTCPCISPREALDLVYELK